MKDVIDFARKSLHISVTPIQITGSQIFACETEITPKMAISWLENHNKKNRNPRQGTIEKQCRDIESGRWVVTHQGIAFDEKEQLTSGQHRLNAVVRCNKSIHSIVFLNCPIEERNAIDQTVVRGVKDVGLLGHGEDISGRLISIARGMAYGVEVSGGMTPQETYEFIKARHECFEFVLQNIKKNVPGVTTAQVLGAVCRAFYFTSKKKLTEFLEVLVSGFSMKDEHRPIILLRNWLLENRDTMGARKGRRLAYSRTESALQSFIKGEIPDRLKIGEVEVFKIAQ